MMAPAAVKVELRCPACMKWRAVGVLPWLRRVGEWKNMSETEVVWARFREAHWWLYAWEYRTSEWWPYTLPPRGIR